MNDFEPLIRGRSLDEADVVLLSVPYDRTCSGRAGASEGPAAIIRCLDEQIELFDIRSGTEPALDYTFFHLPIGQVNDLHPVQMASVVEGVYDLARGKFVFLIGGEHTVSLGAFNSLAKSLDPATVTILQIDAHADLRDDDGNTSPNSEEVNSLAHSTVLRRVHEFGFRIVQVGLRSYCKAEYEYMREHRETITSFEWSGVAKPKVADILQAIKTPNVYIEIDVDGIDPSVMPGTGTPVAGGLDWETAVSLCLTTAELFNVVGAGILEVAPLPNDERTERNAAHLCYQICSAVLTKKVS